MFFRAYLRLDERQNFRLEKFLEVVLGYTGINVVVDGNGYALSVTLAKTKTSRKYYFAFEMSLFDLASKHIDYLLRAFKMARTANANSDDYHLFYLCKNLLFEEFVGSFGREREERVVNRNAHSLLALAHAERAAEFHLFFEVVLGNEILKLLYDLS